MPTSSLSAEDPWRSHCGRGLTKYGAFRDLYHAWMHKTYVGKGLCGTHYQRRALHGDPLYQPTFYKDQPCTVRGCSVFQVAKGYCPKHYQRYVTHDDPLIRLIAEAGHGTISKKDYRIVFKPRHPNANKHGRLPEHRLVMSEMLGRALYAHEVVHHKNGNRLDNRPDNLELWVKTQPCGQRAVDLLAWAKTIMATYASLESNPHLMSTLPSQKSYKKREPDLKQLCLETIVA